MIYNYRIQKLRIMNMFSNLIVLSATVLMLTHSQQCQSPYQRCICSSGSPYCQCTYITHDGSFNYSSSYYSHLVLVLGYGCQPCPPSCMKCLTQTVCSSCNDEFELRNGVCTACPINCKRCSSSICSECMDGYYIDSKTQCQRCPLQGTLECTIDSLKICLPNYFLDNNGATCISCDANCQICSSTTRCSKCNEGFYLQTYKCSACKSECSTCRNGTDCEQCVLSNYYYDQTSAVCSQCPSHCLQCSSYSCEICEANYTVINGQCSGVSSTIQGCLYYEQDTCRECDSGYYMQIGDTTCRYGCSILCVSCRGPHYGLCYGCVDDTQYVNLNCIPVYNIEDGSAFQLYYTAPNNGDVFKGGIYRLQNECIRQTIMGQSEHIQIQLNELQSYKMMLMWKVYVYEYDNDNVTYTLTFSNDNINQSIQFYPTQCDSSCRVCIHKGQSLVSGIILTSNTINFQVQQSNTFIGISEILVKGYRCGGTQGITCAQCQQISKCTKCVNAQYYILNEKCVSQCPSTYYTNLQEMKCYEVCPLGTYSTQLNIYCQSCPQECIGCTSSSECYSCSQGYYFLQYASSCVLQCPSRYYPDSNRRVCEKCLYPCYECMSSQQCVSCSYGFHMEGSCVTVCPVYYYANYVSVQCELCIYPCVVCQSPGTVCLQCASNYSLFGNGCYESCAQGYYSENGTCRVCYEQCKSCVMYDRCLQCEIGFLWQQQCMLSCPSGYYEQLVSRQCRQCGSNCSQCIEQAVCTLCKQNYYLLDSQCVQECPHTYYLSDDDECIKCELPCRQCLSQYECSSCVDSFLLNSECVNECEDGQYADVMSLSCQNCSSPCHNCKVQYGQQKCVSCEVGYYLYVYDCVNECPIGLYTNDQLWSCEYCEQDCVSCVNETHCQICTQGYIMHNYKCVTECPLYYYANNNNNSFVCQLCNQSCTICEGNPNNCLQCKAQYVFYNNQCLQSCSSFHFNLNGYCQQCQLPCLQCESDTYCTQCSQGYWLLGQCFAQCPDTYYEQQYNNTCMHCSDTCLTCHYSGQYCLECRVGSFLDHNHTCVSACGIGLYSNVLTKKCQLCFELCSICLNEYDNCSACVHPYIFHENACLDKCPIGYYDNESICERCSQNCMHCVSAYYCLTCQSPYFVSRSSQTAYCVLQCPPTYFEGSEYCIQCFYPCQDCISQTECLSCVIGFLYNSQCVEDCPIGSYLLNTTLNCLQCAQNCVQCVSYDECLSCNEGVLVNGLCQSQCPLGFYANYGVCHPCIYGCSNCNDGHSCNECQIGFLFQGQCINFCPIAMIEDNGTCISCSQDCIDCSITVDQCTGCVSGKLLYLKSCLDSCPSGTYESYELRQCIVCSNPCQTCLNAYSCQTCLYGYILYKQQNRNQCVKGPSCPNSYYLSQVDNNPVCRLQCDQTSYIQKIGRTCFNVCPFGFVAYEYNMTCLQQCPQESMWIDYERKCRNSTQSHSTLPTFQCTQICVRNIFILDCIVNLPLSNIESLNTYNFTATPQMKIQQVHIINQSWFQIFCTSSSPNITNTWVKLSMLPKYVLQTKQPTAYSNESSSEIYPLQNYQSQTFIKIFHFYTKSQRQTGLFLMQISKSICWIGFAIWFFAFLRNKKVFSLLLIANIQFIYTLSILQNNFAPNLNQFLQGFSVSMLIIDLQTELVSYEPIWQIGTVLREQLIYPHKISDFGIWIVGIMGIIGITLLLYLFLFTGEKLYKCSNVRQQSYFYKLDRKLRILRKRFNYNYIHHISFLLAMPICLSFFSQFLSASIIGIILSIILFFTLVCIIIHSWHLIQVNPQGEVSFKFLFIMGIQNMISVFLSVWCSMTMFIGIILLFSFVNLYLWKFIWHNGINNWKTYFCYILDTCKFLILLSVIISEFKLTQWNYHTLYLYSWFPIALIMLYSILSMIFIARDFFEYEPKQIEPNQTQFKAKSQKENVLLEGEESRNEVEQKKIRQEQSFFQTQHNVKPYEDSDEDIIDFSQQSDDYLKRQRAPKHLIKVEK